MAERLSYKGDIPGSRRAPCLGCGGRVVTARDPYVEIGGKRDGSLLLMYEAEAQQALASDPDRVFEPGLELLGIAHRACAHLARQRLEAQEVDLPDDLPQLTTDEGVSELPALHLPPAPVAAPSAALATSPTSMSGPSGSLGSLATAAASQCHRRTRLGGCARST